MSRIARERLDDLFALAQGEAAHGAVSLAERYVNLARRVGTRYNVRLSAPYRGSYCRRCSAYWIEGASVRTRRRNGRTVRTCLRCGRVYRSGGPAAQRAPTGMDSAAPPPASLAQGALIEDDGGEELFTDDGDGEGL